MGKIFSVSYVGRMLSLSKNREEKCGMVSSKFYYVPSWLKDEDIGVMVTSIYSIYMNHIRENEKITDEFSEDFANEFFAGKIADTHFFDFNFVEAPIDAKAKKCRLIIMGGNKEEASRFIQRLKAEYPIEKDINYVYDWFDMDEEKMELVHAKIDNYLTALETKDDDRIMM